MSYTMFVTNDYLLFLSKTQISNLKILKFIQ